VLGAVLTAILSLGASNAIAQSNRNPYVAIDRDLSRQVVRDARRPRWVIPFVRLMQHYGDVAPDVTLGAVTALSRNRRIPADRRAFIDAMRARLLVRGGHV